MNARETAILTGLLASTEATKNIPAPSGYGVGVARALWREAQDGLIRVDPATWLGRPVTASESVMNGRAYRKLEADGLIERHNLTGGAKTTHLRLTEAGRIAAQHLAAGATDAAD